MREGQPKGTTRRTLLFGERSTKKENAHQKSSPRQSSQKENAAFRLIRVSSLSSPWSCSKKDELTALALDVILGCADHGQDFLELAVRVLATEFDEV
jgi:hypothetical protein